MSTKGKPVCKAYVPELYARHTKHMSRAEPLTYNYVTIDDYIIENYGKKTMRQMAIDLNEYPNRIVYRVQVLTTKGLIMSERKRRSLERQYEKLTEQMVQTYEKAEKIKAKLNKLDTI